jgi:hypothetical protein
MIQYTVTPTAGVIDDVYYDQVFSVMLTMTAREEDGVYVGRDDPVQ